MRDLISPWLHSAFIVRMPQQTRRWIVEMAIVDQHLFGHFIVCLLPVTKYLSVANQKWERHKHAVRPQLPRPFLVVPECAVFRPRPCIECFTNVVGRELVLLLFRLLV